MLFLHVLEELETSEPAEFVFDRIRQRLLHAIEREAYAMGFTHAAVGALVRSSYHADQQAHAAGVPIGHEG
jgi:lipoate synthase